MSAKGRWIEDHVHFVFCPGKLRRLLLSDDGILWPSTMRCVSSEETLWSHFGTWNRTAAVVREDLGFVRSLMATNRMPLRPQPALNAVRDGGRIH